MASTKVQRIMTQPINLIFRFLQSKARIQIWLFEQKDLRIEGRIIGFDEYMNLVLDDADEINVKKNTRKSLGRILLKGDNITLMMNTLNYIIVKQAHRILRLFLICLSSDSFSLHPFQTNHKVFKEQGKVSTSMVPPRLEIKVNKMLLNSNRERACMLPISYDRSRKSIGVADLWVPSTMCFTSDYYLM
ncbi:Small nuclear ribonucleoprotein E [Carex littledalei]|uniref:Small nuclear ribonucleoprotein E n=1 Tax=Carex littledalei TaxID=544730 RepID=A0A833RA10_9POAL|nr:Small nuclear ribonucleoprotein E [Carex littledalei]